MHSETKKQSKWSGSAAVACLALLLGFASTGYGDVIVGNFERADSCDGWFQGSGDADATLIPASASGVTLGSGALKVIPSATGNYWTLAWEGSPVNLTGATLQFDLTMVASEWTVGVWTKVADKIAINSDIDQLQGNNGWKEWNNPDGVEPNITVIDIDSGDATSTDWGRWWDAAPDVHKTYTLDISSYNMTGASWMQIAISTQGRDGTAGFYFDNIRIVSPSMIVSKSKVTAGKTQYHGDEDYNDMKDAFTASGIVSLPPDCNDINEVGVTITSVTDGNVIYTETLSDFNATIVNSKGTYKHTAKAVKGQQGKITSMTLNFRKGTFALTTKNLDLTGLGCPFEIKFTMGSYELTGTATETVVNGKKTIPTRLMRLYDDKLVVTKAKAKHATTPATDTLSVKGEIAVGDMNLDVNEPNLVTKDVNLTWGDKDTNNQTFVIRAGSFKAAKKGHIYKCSKVEADANDGNVGIVAATIDLDKATFTITVKGATGLYATRLGTGWFGISFETPNGTLNEDDDYILP